MRMIRRAAILLGLLAPLIPAGVAVSADTLTVALWHCDEPGGSVLVDASGMGHDAFLSGTVAVNGIEGKARHFNGGWDYGMVYYPGSRFLDISNDEGFEISLWIRTTATEGTIIRRGVDPTPGFLLELQDGYVVGKVGNRDNSVSPDTLVAIRSTVVLNDRAWHHVIFARDRQTRTVTLQVDGVAEEPVPDPIEFPLFNDRPLSLGRRDDSISPQYFFGDLDEIRISIRGRAAPTGGDTLLYLALDEPEPGLIIDASQYESRVDNHETQVVPGWERSARSFDGSQAYLVVEEGVDGLFDFDTNESFTVDCMFKTMAPGYRIMLRKGLAPVPGFALEMMDGHVRGLIGNREDGVPPDTVLDIRSELTYNDGLWHRATLIRDRKAGELFLYVDSRPACATMEDVFPRPIMNDVELNIGRWQYDYFHAAYFEGVLDNVGIYRGARHPVVEARISLSDSTVQFPKVMRGDSASHSIRVDNLGLDTLRLSGVLVSNAAFGAMPPPSIPPRGNGALVISFTPDSAVNMAGILEFQTNDPTAPVVRVHVQGEGVASSEQPTIRAVLDVPGDQGKQVRLAWYRSSLEVAGGSPAVTGYSLWRRLSGAHAEQGRQRPTLPMDTIWELIASIPATGAGEYEHIASTVADSSIRYGLHWSVFMVSAVVAGDSSPTSPPDSGYSVDNLPPPSPPVQVSSVRGSIDLHWDVPQATDVMDYVVERSVLPSDPDARQLLGVVMVTSYHDPSPPATRVYYRVSARDSSGNSSVSAPWVEGIVSSVAPDEGVPTAYALHQNYPNPFNPDTRIRYELPEATRVKLEVFNALGQRIREPVSEDQDAGRHEARFDAAGLPSGVYFARLLAGPFHAVIKMYLLK